MPAQKVTYHYSKLNELPKNGRVYVYGVVKSVAESDFGGPIIKIEDESLPFKQFKDEDGSAIVKVAKKSSKYFVDLKVNDILRLHRAEIGSHCDSPALIVEINNHGCHALSWRGESNVPHLYLVTSKSYSLTDDDLAKLASLHRLSRRITDEGSRENTDEIASPSEKAVEIAVVDQAEEAPTTSSDVGIEPESTAEPAVDASSAKKTPVHSLGTSPAKIRRPFNEIANAAEIPELSNKFFNWHAQVLGVYKGKGEPLTVFLRVWDGSRPKFPAYRNMFRADLNSIETTYCDISRDIFAAVEPYLIDVCCYGDYARKAMSLQVGDVVHLCNIRNYISQTNLISAVTLHEGGSTFGRALQVLTPADPKHFEISKNCADAMTRLLGPLGLPFSWSSATDLTPILPDKVIAQSTPLLSKENPANAGTNKKCNNDDFSSESSSGFSDELVNKKQSNERGVKENIRILANDTPEETVQQICISSEEVDETEGALMIVDEPEDLELDPRETRNLPRRSATSTKSQASPSPKRARKENSSTSAGIREQGLNDTADEQSESLHFSQPSKLRVVQASTPTKRTLPALEQMTPGGSSGMKHFPTRSLAGDTEQEDCHAIQLPEEARIEESSEEHRESTLIVEDSCTAWFLAALERYDESTVEGSSHKDLANQIRLRFLNSRRRKTLKELSCLRKPSYSLAEEIEEVLKMSIGDHVGFVNHAQASMSLMEQELYMRHAVIFVAKCVECGEELIVERCKKIYCVKCFTEERKLAQTVCSWRITIPVEYKRINGELAQLLLLTRQEVWAALQSDVDLFSEERVIESNREENMRQRIVLINNVIRFVKAAMKTRLLSVSDAKIYYLCRLTGSLTLFVDKCAFVVKNGGR